MKLHITNLNGHAFKSVAQMSQNRVTELAISLGFREMGIYSYPSYTDSPGELSSRLDGIIASVSNGDIVVLQSPSWNEFDFDEELLRKLRSYWGVKLAVFIHDVKPFLHKESMYLIDRLISYYNEMDLVIVPSEKMLNKLKEYGFKPKKIIIQGIWDYPISLDLSEPQFKKEINFLGEPSRFPFVNDWQGNIPFNLYAEEEVYNEKITKKGWLPQTKLMPELSEGGFGLVWAEGEEWDYYQFNLSYKLTTYLASNMPVIIKKGISNEQFIVDNNLGLVANSLEEAEQIVQNMTEEKYQEIIASVKNYSRLLRGGYVTKKILLDTVNELLIK